MTGQHGDPLQWSEIPAALALGIVRDLWAHGWHDTYATEHSIVIPLDDRALGLPAQAARGEHLYVLWGGVRPEWSWGTAHPYALAGGHLALLLAPPDDGPTITASILNVLRTGRALP